MTAAPINVTIPVSAKVHNSDLWSCQNQIDHGKNSAEFFCFINEFRIGLARIGTNIDKSSSFTEHFFRLTENFTFVLIPASIKKGIRSYIENSHYFGSA